MELGLLRPIMDRIYRALPGTRFQGAFGVTVSSLPKQSFKVC